jgi:prepilin-type N-terminal cleavage/methylation domain-containing protein
MYQASSIKHQDKGFTLIELLVAMTLFLVLIGIATGGFIRVLRTQRATVDLMSVNDNAVLTMEQIARETRTGSEFSVVGGKLRFINANGLVIYYQLNGDAIERGIGDEPGTVYKKITADNVKILAFNVETLDNGDYPPRITVSMSVTGSNPYLADFSINLQTTISSRVQE